LMKQHGLALYYDHVLEIVEIIKKKYQVVLCSDASHMMADPIAKRIQPMRVFLSDKLGCYKGAKDGRFFSTMLQEFKIEPEEVLHIGDGAGDIRGAALNGIDSCLIRRQDNIWKEQEKSTYMIQDFLELKQILIL